MKTTIDLETLRARESALVDVHGLRPAVFGAKAPSERTLRALTKRGILPHFRIGRLVRYDVTMVREALEKECLVHGKSTVAKKLS